MPQTCGACRGSGEVPTPYEARVAKMGREDTDLVTAGIEATRDTGPVFTLQGGRRIKVPRGSTIKAPDGVEGNDRYFWLIGVFLRDGYATGIEKVEPSEAEEARLRDAERHLDDLADGAAADADPMEG